MQGGGRRAREAQAGQCLQDRLYQHMAASIIRCIDPSWQGRACKGTKGEREPIVMPYRDEERAGGAELHLLATE